MLAEGVPGPDSPVSGAVGNEDPVGAWVAVRPGLNTGAPMDSNGKRRVGCGGLLAAGVIVVVLGIVGLVLIATRSWWGEKVVNAVHDDRPKIHAGRYFSPGATVTEDGVPQTAVMIKGKPHVRVSSPPGSWKREHRNAVCVREVCTAPATSEHFAGVGAVTLGGVGAVLLAGFVTWTLIMGDGGRAR